KPVSALPAGKLTVSVKDKAGNLSRIERTFAAKTVAAPLWPPPSGPRHAPAGQTVLSRLPRHGPPARPATPCPTTSHRPPPAPHGPTPPVPHDLHTRVTGRLDGPSYRVENLVFESRPGLFVTGNLYAPAEPAASMPGILLCHSHHAPKSNEELQDMAITWAQH